jgi:hypothetical protein
MSGVPTAASTSSSFNQSESGVGLDAVDVSIPSPLRCCTPNCRIMFSSSSDDTQAWTMLPCGCNMCGACLEAFLSVGAKEFKCTGCKGTVKEKMVNLLLCRASDKAAGENGAEPVKLVCSECESPAKDASHNCQTCGLLCLEHYNAHATMKSMKSHIVVPITDSDAVAAVSSHSKPDVCAVHPGNALAQYCFKCRAGLCMHCDLQRHFTECRNVKSVIEALPPLRRQLGGQCERLSVVMQKVESAHIETERTLASFDEKMVALRAKLVADFDALLAFVENTKRSALGLLDFEIKERSTMLSEKIILLHRRSEQLAAILAQGSALVEAGSCVDVTAALQWSECCGLADGWDFIGSLHVDAGLAVDTLKDAVNACWSVATLDGETAADKVR